MASISDLSRQWREAQHIQKVLGGKNAAAQTEAARKALADAVHKAGKR